MLLNLGMGGGGGLSGYFHFHMDMPYKKALLKIGILCFTVELSRRHDLIGQSDYSS